MEQLARLGDPSDHGGEIITATAVYTANGIQGAVEGDLHRCPAHGVHPLISGSIVTSNGQLIIRVSDKAACGAKIISGDVNAISV
jgi:uncharacterized Zn-binding protein involved in type VI secretion